MKLSLLKEDVPNYSGIGVSRRQNLDLTIQELLSFRDSSAVIEPTVQFHKFHWAGQIVSQTSFQIPAINLQKGEQSKTVSLKDPNLPNEITELVDRGNVEQITLREEQKKTYIIKFKEDDDDEYV